MIRMTRITVLPKGEPIFSERATDIEIEDEAAGEFLVIKQEKGEISINPEDWPELRKAIDKMVKAIVEIS